MSSLIYPKLAAMIYHIAASLRHPIEGRTRLMKLIYLSDVEAAQRLGRPISEARYFSYTHGPFSKEVLDTLREMRGFWIEEKAISGRNGETIYHYYISQFPHEKLELEEEETAIIEEVVGRWGDELLSDLLAYVYGNEPYKSTPIGYDINLLGVVDDAVLV